MASVAALYDIHGNLAALDAVLAKVPDDATIVVGGDVCAGGEQPSEVLARLRGLGDRVVWVRGNADRELHPGEEGLASPEFLEQARSQLSAEEIEEDDGTLVLQLHVAEDDIGKVIGRQGRLVRALRTIVRAGGVEAGRRLQLEIAD